MGKHWFWSGLGVLMGALLAAGWLFSRPYELRGSVLEPAPPAPDFQLSRSDGSVFHLAEENGKVNLIFFGYTNCPDVCPATLGEMKTVYDRLGGDAAGVNVVFVTVDPQRDTAQRLAAYTAAFDPNFIGLSGTEEALSKIWAAYGVFREVTAGDTALGYLISHTARVYVVDRRGGLRLTYAFGTPVDDIFSDVKFLLKETTP